MAQDNPRADRRAQLECIASALTAMEIPRDDPWGVRNLPVVWRVRRHLCWRLERIEFASPRPVATTTRVEPGEESPEYRLAA